MTGIFGPQNAHALTAKPVISAKRRYGDGMTWFKDCSAPGAGNGTVADADFFNILIGNLQAVVDAANLTPQLRTDTNLLVNSIREVARKVTLSLGVSEAQLPGTLRQGTTVATPAQSTTALTVVNSAYVYTAVTAAINALVAAAPLTLDTLAEIDAALNNDPNFASTVMTAIATKANKGANSDITSLSALTTALSAPQGGTGFSTYAIGDLLFASSTSALSRLAAVATGNVLISGGVGAPFSWGKVDLTAHVTGRLGTANMAQAAAGTLRGNPSGATADVSDNALTSYLDTLGTTRGSIAVRGAATWQALAPSAAGQVPMYNGTDTVFAAPGGSAVVGFRNRLINGAMAIDQRNNGASVNASGYTLDRWMFSNSGTANTVQRFGSTSGYTMRITGVSGNTFCGAIQPIEAINVYDLAGLNAVLSAKLSASAPVTVSWQVQYAGGVDNFGSQTTIASGSFNVTTTPTVFSSGAIAMPAGAGTTQNGVRVIFSVNLAAGATLDITNAQFEGGSVATQFEARPIAFELSMSQRYYYVGNRTMRIHTTTTGGTGQIQTYMPHPTTMRTTPSLTFNNVTYSTAQISALASGNVSAQGWEPSVTMGTTAASTLVQFDVAASAEIN